MIRTLDWINGYKLKQATITGLVYVCDWVLLGKDYDAVVFVVSNTGGVNPVTVTVEASETGSDVEVGPMAPEPFSLSPGTSGRVTYGNENMRSYWRMALNSTSTTVSWGIKGVRRMG